MAGHPEGGDEHSAVRAVEEASTNASDGCSEAVGFSVHFAFDSVSAVYASCSSCSGQGKSKREGKGIATAGRASESAFEGEAGRASESACEGEASARPAEPVGPAPVAKAQSSIPSWTWSRSTQRLRWISGEIPGFSCLT